MFNWLPKWAGGAASPPTPVPVPDASAEAAAPAPQPSAPPVADWAGEGHDSDGFNVQTASMRWVFSLGTVGGPALSLGGLADAIERMSLDTTRAADWAPRAPGLLAGLLNSLRDEVNGPQGLARLIEQDPLLVTEALKAANNAQHQRTITVTQAAEALDLLGSAGMRRLVARAAYRPMLGEDAGPLIRAGAPKVWSLGDACADCSHALAAARGVDPFEAFLAGLALQAGYLVALRMADRVAHLARPDPHGLGPRSVPVGEAHTHASDNHAAQDMAFAMGILSHRVAARWELPDNVVGAITAQVDPLAKRRWPAASELLSVAQETARLRVLDQAGKVPTPLAEACAYLPDDAQAWLLAQPR